MPEVTTPSGTLRGLALEGADAFLGIPYAEQPVRFQPPVPVPRVEERDATTFGPSAPQVTGGPFADICPGMGVGEQSEDCLSLNVWAPRGAAGAPVLVWLHGGAFVSGGSSVPTYDGRLLAAEQQVVVVSANYRLGALGWLSLDGGTTNCGLLDQLLALRWVQDNIAALGGDPGNVTVFGESAGAASVLHLLASPQAEGLLHKAILQSPNASATLSPETAATVSAAFLAALDGADPRTAPLEQLLAAQQKAGAAMFPVAGAMPFHPTVDGDLIPRDPREPDALLPVPVLAGSTSEEMRLFTDPALSQLDRAGLVGVLQPFLSIAAQRPLGIEAVTAAVDAYAVEHPEGADLFAALTTDQVMRLPLTDVLDRHRGPVHAYSFTWQATGAPRPVGAGHAMDLPFTFGTLGVDRWADWLGDRDQAEGLSRAMREAWASFARTGTPAAKGLPDWPRYDGSRLTMMLGRTVEVAPDPLAAGRTRCAPLASH